MPSRAQPVPIADKRQTRGAARTSSGAAVTELCPALAAALRAGSPHPAHPPHPPPTHTHTHTTPSPQPPPPAPAQVVTALLRSLRAPFKESADSTPMIGRLEATGHVVAEWLAADSPAVLAAIIPPLGGAAAAAPPAAPVPAAPLEAAPAEAPGSEAAPAGESHAAAGEVATAGLPDLQPALAAATAAAAAAVAGLGRGRCDDSSLEDADGLEEELSKEAR